MKILIVEDDFAYQDCYRDHLGLREKRGDDIKVRFVESYSEFIVAVAELRPDIVWTDHRIIGKENGADVANWMVSNLPDTPCISVSSLHEAGYPASVTHLGKSFRISMLYQGSRQWVKTGVEPEWFCL